MSFMSVDLPAPLRPRMPMRSPGFTERPTPRNHRALAVAGRCAIERDQRLRKFVRRGELPLEGVEFLVCGDGLELRQRLDAALHLARLAGLRAEAVDEGMQPRGLALPGGRPCAADCWMLAACWRWKSV